MAYQESWFRLQKTTPRLPSYEDRVLYSTWGISYAQVERQNANSARLLQLWAYFDHEDLWFELLREGHNAGPRWFQELTSDAFGFHDAARVLCYYGLIEPDTSRAHGSKSGGYGMHGCVHMWVRHVLNEERDNEMARLAMRCVGAHVPRNTEREYWVVQRRLMGHAGRCVAVQTAERIPIGEGEEWILLSLGDLLAD